MRETISRFLFGLAMLPALVFAVGTAAAQGVTTKATHALIMDGNSGDILFEKNGYEPIPPASMSKLMTAAIVLDQIKQGKIGPDTPFDVSEKAWRTGGSKMFVLVNTQIKVRDLLEGLITLSGNDAAVVLAENISGSEEAFVELMNAKAKEWGLETSQFSSPNGMIDEGQLMSVADIANLSRLIWETYPEYRYLFSIPEMTWSEITQKNRNPLLGIFEGADGMKTGHTEESGYGLVGSAERDGVRRIIVVAGLDSMAERREEGLRMMEIAFRDFLTQTYYETGEVVDEIPVFGGRELSMPVRVDVPIRFTRHRTILAGAEAKLIYPDPIIAPIREGEQVAVMRLSLPGETEREYPLYAAKTVEEEGVIAKMGLGLKLLFTPPELANAQ